MQVWGLHELWCYFESNLCDLRTQPHQQVMAGDAFRERARSPMHVLVGQPGFFEAPQQMFETVDATVHTLIP